MSNLQALITSGILELYVLGLASEEETNEVKTAMAKHPELQQELNAIRNALLAYSSAHRVATPSGLKESILEQLQQSPTDKNKAKSKNTVKDPSPTYRNKENETSAARALLLGLLAIGFVLATAAAYYFYQEVDKTTELLKAEKEKITALSQNNNERTQTEAELINQLAFIRKKGIQQFQIKGTEKSPEAFVSIYYDSAARTGYFDPVALPNPGEGKIYHLWSITGGKVTFIARLDTQKEDKVMQLLEKFDKPNSFIITLESTPRAESPDLGNIILAGVVPRT